MLPSKLAAVYLEGRTGPGICVPSSSSFLTFIAVHFLRINTILRIIAILGLEVNINPSLIKCARSPCVPTTPFQSRPLDVAVWRLEMKRRCEVEGETDKVWPGVDDGAETDAVVARVVDYLRGRNRYSQACIRRIF